MPKQETRPSPISAMTEYDDVLTNQPVVIDNVRAGLRFSPIAPFLTRHRARARSKLASLARSTQSRSSRPSMSLHPLLYMYGTVTNASDSVGRPKHVRVMAGALEGDMFIGRRAQEYRGLLKIRYPMEHGIVTNWEDMEKIWGWVYQEELGTLPEEVCIECGTAYIFASKSAN